MFYLFNLLIYAGLPPSPPASAVNNNVGYGTIGSSNAGTTKPLGVDVRKQNKKLSGRIVAVIVLSSFIALILCVGAAWLLLKRRDHICLPTAGVPHTLLPSFVKQSGMVVAYGLKCSFKKSIDARGRIIKTKFSVDNGTWPSFLFYCGECLISSASQVASTFLC